ncbi:hypothetical protein HRR83_006606 [Exophiala dermatitidis]|uniref:Uncharacterized protein n=1 Tax=Exophiala dermatitidis TaxID=5970 RepID=A0AAN6ITL8_EXODE|nr:hypothetical protein HRR75_005284 [Exophiala dermatitidis]KAJ4514107.1 hypothetical protein HRR74_005766 [Exophiala dermatitidis]KAJ4533756.1 hypothetical protein HRR77_008241 [Exophiala dermatitidis]KAJ4541682.1 hypothetical protein HRR78_007272 [Exophiala dermatitidis]KAJ4569849.1 hypothetical protein HRR81_006325 [Exophiala dermatitidis]
MADIERIRRIQHAHETNALNYGHLGTATYDEQNHTWHFLRQNRVRRKVDSGDQTSHVLDEGSLPQGHHSASHRQSLFSIVDDRIWEHDHGDLTDSVQSKWKGPRESEAIADAGSGNEAKRTADARKNTFLKQVPDAAFAILDLRTAALSPLQLLNAAGTLQGRNVIAFGNARSPASRDTPNKRLHPLVAFPAGASGETLRLVGLDAYDVSFSNVSGLKETCKVPGIGLEITGKWTKSAEPILHIVPCPNSQYRTQLIVVKASEISILRPLMVEHTSPRSAEEDVDDGLNDTRLLVDPGLVVTLPSSRTGGSPHAHAACNPQDRSLLAVVGSEGVWSIWKVKGTRSRSARVLYRAQLQCSNDLGLALGNSPSAAAMSHYDGWHRVCWLVGEQGFGDRILVCNRRKAAVFDVTGKSVGSVDLRLGPLSEGNQILDIKDSDRRKDHVVVLTTSRLLIFSSSEISWKDRAGVEPLTLVCSWNHYRDRDDLSLRMSLWEMAQVTSVLIWSRTSHHGVVYHFGASELNQNMVSIQDPSTFEFPKQLQSRMKHVVDIVLYPINPAVSGSSSKHAYHGFIKLVAYLDDGAVTEAVYEHAVGTEITEDSSLHIFTLALTGSAGGRVQSAMYVKEDETDDFVVDDNNDDFDNSDIVRVGNVQPKPSLYESRLPHFRDWERLLDYDDLMGQAHASTSLEEVLDQTTQKLRSMSIENEHERTHLLSDLLATYQIADVERESEFLTSWLDELRDNENVSVEMADAHLGVLPGSSLEKYLDLYDDFVETYIEPLSSEVIDRNRVNREKLVRRAAAEAFLSNAVLTVGSQNPAKTISMSILEEPRSSPGLESDQEGASSSQISASQSPLPPEEPAVARLRRYAGFEEVVPPLRLVKDANISNILAHLPDTIEEDPEEYSYRQVTQRLKLAQEEMATQSLDPRERRKAARHAARLQKRLQKTAKLSQEAMAQRTLLPTISTGSQVVTLPGRDVQSSQAAQPASSQTASQSFAIPGLTMTQPERGAFGGRPERKAKAKGKAKNKSMPGF